MERRLREKVNIDGNQFGFMPGKGTTEWTDAIFVVRQMQVKLVDLEKAFDRVPRGS